MKTRTATTRPLPGSEEPTIGPLYEVTITGVGTKTLPLPYAWGILFDTHIKGLHAVSHDANGELFIELTRDRQIIGGTPEAEEFKNWVLFMFKQFEQYVAVLTRAPVQVPEPVLPVSAVPAESAEGAKSSEQPSNADKHSETASGQPARHHSPRRGRR